MTFSFIFFYLFSENHVQVHIAFIANFHILNSVTTTAMIAVCALVQFLTADLHFEWNRVYVQMLSAVKIQKMFSFWSIFWPKQGARNASCTISRRTKCIGAKFFSRTIPFICLSQMLNVNKLVSEAQSEHACLRSSMTTRLSQIFNDNTLVSGEVDKFLGNHEPDENRSLPCCFCRLLDALSRGTCLSHICHPQQQVKKLSPDFKRWPACRTCSALASCPLFFSRASSTSSPSSSPWGLSGSFKRQPDLLDLYQAQIQPQPQPQNQHQHQHQNQHQHQHQTTTSLSTSISTSTTT